METKKLIENYTGSPDSKEWKYIMDNVLYPYEDYLKIKAFNGRLKADEVKWLYELHEKVYPRVKVGCSTCPGVVRLRLRRLEKGWERHIIPPYEESNVFKDNIIPLLKNFKERYEKRK